DSLAAFDDPAIAPILFGHFKSLSPEARRKAVDALVKRRERVPALIKALEEQQIELSAIETPVRARLLEDPESSVAQRASRLFQSPGSDRMTLVEGYRDVLKMTGDRERGKKIFEDKCAKCHMPRRQGGRVGPDLSGISNKTKEELITSILNPSYAIE